MHNLLQLNFKEEQTILIPAKYNHKCTKEIKILPFRLFSKTFLNKFQNLFSWKWKNSINLVQIITNILFYYLFSVFWGVLLENTNGKNFSPEGDGISLLQKVLSYRKNIYYFTIAIINKCFEFANDWLKIIRTRYNCTPFYTVPLC